MKVGDVVTLPISKGHVGFGQILEVVEPSGSVFFFGAFDLRSSAEDADGTWRLAVERPLVLFGLTMDSLIKHGDWRTVGNADLPAEIPWPAYKLSVGTAENVHVEDHRRVRSRPATEVERLSVPFRVTVGPVEFELAMRAHFGTGDWDADLEELKVSRVVLASTVFDR